MNDNNQYHIEYELNGTDPDVALYKDNASDVSAFKPLPVSEGDIVGAVVQWNYGDTDITVYNYVNTDLKHTISITDTEYTNPGISMFVNSNLTVTIDGIRITDTY